jgi:hypothetical protein
MHTSQLLTASLLMAIPPMALLAYAEDAAAAALPSYQQALVTTIPAAVTASSTSPGRTNRPGAAQQVMPWTRSPLGA